MLKQNALRSPPQTLHLVPEPVPSLHPGRSVVPATASPAMRGVLAQAERVADSALPVVVTGETGAGKEVLVRYLHALSPRADGPFVAENCSAIPEALAESLLFGHVRGAFTGADRDRQGLFDQADGGTLFLDEIGDMPLLIQARLLRVLEERRVRPVGGHAAHLVDVRIVCATNHDLAELVRQGRFRADLRYRLDGVTLRIPALRERPEDVELLAARFLDELNTLHGTRRYFARALTARMAAHRWPGNVRELRNRVAALYHLSAGDEIDGELPDSGASASTSTGASTDGPLVTRAATLAEIEHAAIQLALAVSGGDRREAARRLGISRSTLYARLSSQGCTQRADAPGPEHVHGIPASIDP